MTMTELAQVGNINPIEYAVVTNCIAEIEWQKLSNYEIVFYDFYSKNPELKKKAVTELRQRIDKVFSSNPTLQIFEDRDLGTLASIQSVQRYFPELTDYLAGKLEPLAIATINAAKKGEDLAHLHNYVRDGSKADTLLAEKKDELVNRGKAAQMEKRIAKKDFAISKEDFWWLVSSPGSKLIGTEFFDAFKASMSQMSYEELGRCREAVCNVLRPAYLSRLFEIATFDQMISEVPTILDLALSSEEETKLYGRRLMEKMTKFEQLRVALKSMMYFKERDSLLAAKAISLVRTPSDVAELVYYSVSSEKRIELLRQFEKPIPTPQG